MILPAAERMELMLFAQDRDANRWGDHHHAGIDRARSNERSLKAMPPPEGKPGVNCISHLSAPANVEAAGLCLVDLRDYSASRSLSAIFAERAIGFEFQSPIRLISV